MQVSSDMSISRFLSYVQGDAVCVALAGGFGPFAQFLDQVDAQQIGLWLFVKRVDGIARCFEMEFRILGFFRIGNGQIKGCGLQMGAVELQHLLHQQQCVLPHTFRQDLFFAEPFDFGIHGIQVVCW